jgi:hypothetical protein
MSSSLPTEPAGQNIKAVDVAEFAEIAKIVESATQTGCGARGYPKLGERTPNRFLAALWCQC